MKTNSKKANQNLSPNITLLPTFQQLSQINKLPQNIRSILIQNKLLLKHNHLLREELNMKKVIIRQLKLEIDKTIVQDTKDKLHYIRVIENQVELKTQKILSQYYSNIANFEDNLKSHQMEVRKLENQIKKQKKINILMAQNVVQLKQYIIQAMDEKDHIIQELKQIIMRINNKNSDNKLLSNYEHQKLFKNNHMTTNFCQNEFQPKSNVNFKQQKSLNKKPYLIKNSGNQLFQRGPEEQFIKVEQNHKIQEKKAKSRIKAKIVQNI